MLRPGVSWFGCAHVRDLVECRDIGGHHLGGCVLLVVDVASCLDLFRVWRFWELCCSCRARVTAFNVRAPVSVFVTF